MCDVYVVSSKQVNMEASRTEWDYEESSVDESEMSVINYTSDSKS